MAVLTNGATSRPGLTFYQDDRDVVKYLKYFTFLSHEEIDELAEKVKTEPWKREAQKRLAEEVTKFVHGEAGLDEAKTITKALFSGNVKSLTTKQVENALAKAPSADSTSEPKKLVDFLVDAKIESSKRQAREDIKNGAIYINGDRVQDVDFVVDPAASRTFSRGTISPRKCSLRALMAMGNAPRIGRREPSTIVSRFSQDAVISRKTSSSAP